MKLYEVYEEGNYIYIIGEFLQGKDLLANIIDFYRTDLTEMVIRDLMK